jgi:hypothetical protein
MRACAVLFFWRKRKEQRKTPLLAIAPRLKEAQLRFLLKLVTQYVRFRGGSN